MECSIDTGPSTHFNRKIIINKVQLYIRTLCSYYHRQFSVRKLPSDCVVLLLEALQYDATKREARRQSDKVVQITQILIEQHESVSARPGACGLEDCHRREDSPSHANEQY